MRGSRAFMVRGEPDVGYRLSKLFAMLTLCATVVMGACDEALTTPYDGPERLQSTVVGGSGPLGVGIVCAATRQVAISDNFDDNMLDPVLWTSISGGGASVSEVNQRLEISGSTGGAFGGVFLNLPFSPDAFDVEVDYTLLDWATDDDFILASIAVFLLDNQGEGEAYMGRRQQEYEAEWDLPPGGFVDMRVPTAGASGRLRMTSDGSSVSAYYWSGGTWQLLLSTSSEGPAGPVILAILQFQDVPEESTVMMAFDNFSVTGEARIDALIASLIQDVIDHILPSGILRSLTAKLDATMRVLVDCNERNDVAAANALSAFINEVEALRGNQLANAEADQLVAAAQVIIGALGF